MQEETAHITVTWMDLQPLCVLEFLGSIPNNIIVLGIVFFMYLLSGCKKTLA
jgi:hypothetical protein